MVNETILESKACCTFCLIAKYKLCVDWPDHKTRNYKSGLDNKQTTCIALETWVAGSSTQRLLMYEQICGDTKGSLF